MLLIRRFLLALLLCLPLAAHAGALDDIALVAVPVSPRETVALHNVLKGQQFKGEDQEAEARISEALDFAAVDAQAASIKAAKGASAECKAATAAGAKRGEAGPWPACEPEFGEFSSTPVSRKAPKSDLSKMIGWLKDTSLSGVYNEILNPLVRRIRAAVAK